MMLMAAQEVLRPRDELTTALSTGNYEIAPELCLLMMLLRPAQWKRLLLAYAAFQQAASERLQKPLGSS